MTADGNTRVAVEVAGDNSHDISDAPLSKLHLCQAPGEATRASADGNDSGLPRRSPLKAVRAHCRWCCDGNAREVASCPANHCPLWLLRSGHRPEPEALEQNGAVSLHPGEHPVTASVLNGSVLKAIRRRCVSHRGSLALSREHHDVQGSSCRTEPSPPCRACHSAARVRLVAERLSLKRLYAMSAFTPESRRVASSLAAPQAW